MAQLSETQDYAERTLVCFVLDDKRSVQTNVNPRRLEVYEAPDRPPVKSVVTRLDLTAYEVGTKLRVKGVVTDDAIYGAVVLGSAHDDEGKADMSRSEAWADRAKEYTGFVRDRTLFIHGYKRDEPAIVYQAPELPPITSVTHRLDMDLYEGKWIKVRAVEDRGNLWGAIFIRETSDPNLVSKERVLDTDSLAQASKPGVKSTWSGARRIVLGLNMSESSPLVFDYVLREITAPEDYLLVYVQIAEVEPLAEKKLREQRALEWKVAAKKQAVTCDVIASCLDVKAVFPGEVERVGANTVVCGSQVGAPAGSVFHASVADFCRKQCKREDGSPVRVRGVKIPSERHLTQSHSYILEDLE